MIKEDKSVDFLTTGRQPSEEDFARISEWIKRDKQKQAARKTTAQPSRKKHLAQSSKQGGSHPLLLTEPYVNLSIHTALQDVFFN